MSKSKKKLPMPMRMDKRFAIKPQSKRDKVVSLFEDGWSLTRLSKKFEVVINTISYIVDEDFRQERLDANRYNVPTEATRQNYIESRKEREPRIRRHYAMGLAQNS